MAHPRCLSRRRVGQNGSRAVTDSQLQSVHLEGSPRRQDYRAARDRLHGSCGELTLAGHVEDLPFGHPALSADAPTLAGSPATHFAYFLLEGTTEHPLAVGINTVGRLSSNSVAIPDEHISRRHCAVVIHQDGRLELHDVASKNGTLLNGHRVPGPTPLQPGDTITLCTRRVTVVARPVGDPLDGLV